jgi:hypothetical protein
MPHRGPERWQVWTWARTSQELGLTFSQSLSCVSLGLEGGRGKAKGSVLPRDHKVSAEKLNKDSL